MCVVLKGGSIGFYKDSKAFKSHPDSTYKGEPPVDISGATAEVASDYTKKKHVFRLKWVSMLWYIIIIGNAMAFFRFVL